MGIDVPQNGGARLDDRRFVAFVATQYKLVPRHARALGIPVDQVEDILQYSLEKLWRSRAVVESSAWAVWLWQAMLWYTLDAHRRDRCARTHEAAVTFHFHESSRSTSPEDDTHQQECARELTVLLGHLVSERREVVRLYLIDDLPMQEVADRLGISENTAKDRWRIACADMAAEWKRKRAKERSALRIAVFVSTVGALFLALWRWITRRGTHYAHPLLACAACVLLVGAPASERQASPGAEDAPAPMLMTSTVSALREAMANEVVQKASTSEPAVEAPKSGLTLPPRAEISAATAQSGTWQQTARLGAAHKMLAEVLQLHRSGRAAQAHDLLRLYHLIFLDDPLSQEAAAVARKIATP